MQLYSLQLKPDQTWQVWPDDVSLLEFLDGGLGLDVVDMTIESLMSDISREMTAVAAKIDEAHTQLKESMQSLESTLLDYQSSTVISEAFV